MSKNNNIVLAFGLGMLVGYLVNEKLVHNSPISPEQALKFAKNAFKEHGPVSGSWIYMKPENIKKNGLSYNAYRGGITRTFDGENKQYDFYVDSKTGVVIASNQAT